MDTQNGQIIWNNPCHIDSRSTTTDDKKHTTLNDIGTLFDVIGLQASIALGSAEEDAPNLVNLMYPEEKDYNNFVETWSSRDEKWLYPEHLKIYKNYSGEVKQEYIDILSDSNMLQIEELEKLLLDTYERFQYVVMGIEQSKIDNQNDKRYKNEKKKKFTVIYDRAIINIKSVLCEVDSAFIVLNTMKRPDITINVIPEASVTKTDMELSLRDWIIYREYMNQLQLTIFEYNFLKGRLSNTN